MDAPISINYTTLVQMVQDFLQRKDDVFVANIPNFIKLCEQDLSIKIKNLGNEKFVISSNYSQILEKPANWRQNVSLMATNTVTGANNFLISRQFESCQYYDSESTIATTTDLLPVYYADMDFYHWYLTRISPSVILDQIRLDIAYYAFPSGLSVDNETNWWTSYCPQALFYGTLYYASVYQQNDERAAHFIELFNGAITDVNNEDKNRFTDQTYARKTPLQGSN